MLRYIPLFLSLAIVLLACGQSNIKQVDVEGFQQLVKQQPNIQIIDLRTKEEHIETGLIGAPRCIDFLSDSGKQVLATLDPNVPVVLYCRSGRRSMNAANLIVDQFNAPVYNFKGGINAWIKADKPVQR